MSEPLLFLLGFLVTVGVYYLGVRHGRRKAEREYTLDTYEKWKEREDTLPHKPRRPFS